MSAEFAFLLLLNEDLASDAVLLMVFLPFIVAVLISPQTAPSMQPLKLNSGILILNASSADAWIDQDIFRL